MSNLFRVRNQTNHPDISTWNVGEVTNMYLMFYNATSFNQPIGNWVTINVTDMSFMFRSASSFNQDIGGWDVSNVRDFTAMFKNNTSFDNKGSNLIIGLFIEKIKKNNRNVTNTA